MMAGIVLLKGYKTKSSSAHKAMGKLIPAELDVDVFCPDAPYVIDTDNPDETGWWKLDGPVNFQNDPKPYEDVEKAIESVKEKIKDYDKPIIVVGFSQGAVLAEILASGGHLKNVIGLVLLSSSGITDDSYKGKKHNIPTLMMWGTGESETLYVDKEVTLGNTTCTHYSIKSHSQGHVVPSRSIDKNVVKGWLHDLLSKK
jgi:predicted esterase